MKPERLSSYIIRIETYGDSLWLTVQNIRTGEMREYASFEALIKDLKTPAKSNSPPEMPCAQSDKTDIPRR